MNIKVDYCFYKEYIKLNSNFEVKMKKRIKDIRDNNGISIVVNEKNILEVETMLTTCQILGGRTL